tara:strand:+ start:402 stop:596 length:195 start_codon:yes stop_codon:yes gene_type:complete
VGYEDEMNDWYEEQNINIPLNVGSMKFNRKNLISSNGVSFRRIVWEYFCWTLAGKPENWRVNGT